MMLLNRRRLLALSPGSFLSVRGLASMAFGRRLPASPPGPLYLARPNPRSRSGPKPVQAAADAAQLWFPLGAAEGQRCRRQLAGSPPGADDDRGLLVLPLTCRLLLDIWSSPLRPAPRLPP